MHNNEINNACERQRLFTKGYGNAEPISEDELLSRTEATCDYYDHVWPTEDQLSVMEQSYDQFQVDGGEE